MTVHWRRFFIFLHLLLLPNCVVFPAFAESSANIIKYWTGTRGRNDFDLALLKKALEETRAEYGAYRIEEVNVAFGVQRGRREIELAERVNMYSAPLRPPEIAEHENIIAVPFSTMKGLLGYRALIAHEADLAALDALQNLEDLRKISVGQGQGWVDSAIYRANGIEVVEGSHLHLLFPMLNRRRFTILPLGVGEIERSYKEFSSHYPLVIYPNLLIYYPLPVVYQVSAKEPELAKRIELGLRRLHASGEHDAFFQKSFATVLQALHKSEARVIVLKNPQLPADYGIDQPILMD